MDEARGAFERAFEKEAVPKELASDDGRIDRPERNVKRITRKAPAGSARSTARSHPFSRSHPRPRLKALREEETRAATALLGLPSERLHFLEFPDGQTLRERSAQTSATNKVAHLVRRYGAGSILATWEHDPHSDHVAAHLIAQDAARLTGARLLSYPVWGWTLPPGHLLLDQDVMGARLHIARRLPAKRRAIAAHASQHPGLIADDPSGFFLTSDMLAFHDRSFEVFLFSPEALSSNHWGSDEPQRLRADRSLPG